MNTPTKKQIKLYKLGSLMWLKKRKLEDFDLARHPECEKKVTKICKRYIDIELEILEIKG